MDSGAFDRIGLVVHPRRELSSALATVRQWAERNSIELVQVPAPGQEQEVAPPGGPDDCDLVMALGGDGTALVALHAAAPAGKPVLGVACGSLGALTAVTADRLEHALGRVAAGDWTPWKLPALVGERDGHEVHAVNDLVFVRGGAGQALVEIEIGGERFARFAGDGLVAATPIGSTAYTIAAGGPMLGPGTTGVALSPIAPHGGSIPPVVVGPGIEIDLLLDPGNGGARLELDGRVAERLAPQAAPIELALWCREEFATLVSLDDEESLMAGLRRRRIILDSPRILARDDREAAAGKAQTTSG